LLKSCGCGAHGASSDIGRIAELKGIPVRDGTVRIRRHADDPPHADLEASAA